MAERDAGSRRWTPKQNAAADAANGQSLPTKCTRRTSWPSPCREIEQFLYREARYLDDREFDKWLDCYAPDSEFWMPAWDDDDTLVTDPQTEISLIYYNNQRRAGGSGLPHQDRPVQRDEPARTAHQPQHLQRRDRQPDRRARSRCGSTGSPSTTAIRTSTPTSARRFYTLAVDGTSPLIKKKKVVLKNDYIHHVVDIYHV